MHDNKQPASRLNENGLLIDYPLEDEQHSPVIGSQFGDAVEDDDSIVRNEQFRS